MDLLRLVSARPTSPQQVVVVEFGKRHERTFARDNFLRTCYGETRVMDFGNKHILIFVTVRFALRPSQILALQHGL